MQAAPIQGSPKKTMAHRRTSAILFPSATSMRSPSPPMRSGSPGHEDDGHPHVKKNNKGGILITPEEIQSAFHMLDAEHTGQLTLATMKKRLGGLFPNMTAKEYRFLMNNKKEMNLEDLKDLLLENEVTHFDPIRDAFSVFDPEETGFISEEKLRSVFAAFGLGELTDEELEILKRTVDIDGDGKLNIDDFRGLMDGATAKKVNVLQSMVSGAQAASHTKDKDKHHSNHAHGEGSGAADQHHHNSHQPHRNTSHQSGGTSDN